MRQFPWKAGLLGQVLLLQDTNNSHGPQWELLVSHSSSLNSWTVSNAGEKKPFSNLLERVTPHT